MIKNYPEKCLKNFVKTLEKYFDELLSKGFFKKKFFYFK